jgi:predicted membrane-bound spermidine synthase
MVLAVYAIFFLSGASALLFETLWFQQAGLALGNSIWASSLVLAAFMGGLALGNALAGTLAHRAARPMRLYAVLELVIGATGLALVYGLPQLGPLVAPLLRPVLDDPVVSNAIRIGVAFPLLLIPSTAMGATLPLLVAQLHRRDPHFGRVLGRLYGWNTLGAVLGALAGHAFLFEWLGLRGSGLVAAGANTVAAFAAGVLSRKLEPGAAPAVAASPHDPLPRRALGLLVAAFLCGGALLALEVVWFRFLVLFTLPGSLAFALMLSVVLAGIGAGGLLAARILSVTASLPRWLAAIAGASGVLCVAGYAGFDLVIARVPPELRAEPWGVVAFALFLMFPVSLLSGVLFAGIGEAVNREAPAAPRSAGLLTLANTTGAMLGSLIGGFVLLPGLGIERSVQLLGMVYGVTAGCLWLFGPRPETRVARTSFALAGLALVAAVIPLFPVGRMRERYLTYPILGFMGREQAAPVAIRESLTETILYLRSEVLGETRHYRLVTNSHSMSSTSFQSQRYMRLFVWLPVALHPAPRNALLISYGVGSTAKALTDTRELERIDMVDVSRDILEMNRIVYPEDRDYPLADPRVHVHIEDGRHFLSTTDRQFDLITGEPPPPKAAGIVSLYTREFFELAKSRLAEGGILSYWLPVHALTEREAGAILRAFCDVFDDCSLWDGSGLDWIMLGTRNAKGPGSDARFERQWHDPVVLPWLLDLGVEVPQQLGTLFMAGPDDLAELTRGVAPLEDDHPKRLGQRNLRPSTQVETFRPWLDAGVRRERFERSPWIARIWPPGMRAATLPYFSFEPRIDDYLLEGVGRERNAAVDIPAVDRVLRTSPLTTLALWEMKTNVDVQRPARVAFAKGGRGAVLEFERGAHALAARDFDTATDRFSASFAAVPAHRDSLYYALYALGMAGRTGEARARAEREGVTNGATPGDREIWSFLTERFELNETKPAPNPLLRGSVVPPILAPPWKSETGPAPSSSASSSPTSPTSITLRPWTSSPGSERPSASSLPRG